MEKENRQKIEWWKQWSFLVLLASPVLVFFTGGTLFDWILCVALYFFRMFFITAGYHRYFSHRTFKTSRIFQFLLAFFSQSSLQKGALWWAANHRIHHKYSDTEKDPHSANVYGFWYSHLGWILAPDYKPTRYDLIKDLARYKELVWLNKYHAIPAVVMAIAVYFIGNAVNGHSWIDWSAGISTLCVGFLLSTVLLFHGTFTINSLMHKIGNRRYDTKDHSRNSIVLALITLGEGWHNNHHYYQSTARQGFYWWEIDITYYVIRTLGLFGIVWDIREVPKHIRESNKIQK